MSFSFLAWILSAKSQHPFSLHSLAKNRHLLQDTILDSIFCRKLEHLHRLGLADAVGTIDRLGQGGRSSTILEKKEIQMEIVHTWDSMLCCHQGANKNTCEAAVKLLHMSVQRLKFPWLMVIMNARTDLRPTEPAPRESNMTVALPFGF
jgi:hypothetical protein